MPTGLGRFLLPAVVVAVLGFGAQVVVATPSVPASSSGAAPSAVVSSGSKAVFVPVPQKRVLATTSISPTAPRKVTVAGVAGVPADALAVVVNVAAVKPAKAGFLVAYPAGVARPSGVFTLTYAAGQVDESVATVKVGALRQITVYASTTAPVVVDVVGYYVDHNHDDAYLPKAAAQGRSAANALSCPTGSLIRSVAADGATTCVQDATGPVSGTGFGLLLANGVLSAEQGRSAANAFTCPVGQYLRSVAADGTPTCVVDQTGAGGGFSIGDGLLLADNVLSAEQGRSATNAFTCQSGQVLRAVAKDGAPTCVVDKDTDTTYAAGFGMLLVGNVFSAEQGRSAVNAFTCPAGQYLQAVAKDGAPTCAADRDTNTTYGAGFGLLLTDGVFSAEQGRSAANAFTCAVGQYLQSVGKDGTPVCALDKDTNTTYSAGVGLLLANGVFSADRSAANAYTCPTGQYLQAVAANGAPTCAADKDTDTNTTYSAGIGLLLANGVFSADRSAANAYTCPTGQYLQAVAANGAPTCVADKDTTYAAGAGLSLAGGTFTAEQRRSVANAFTCPPGQYLRVVAADGTPTCAVDVDTDTNTTYSAGSGLLLNNGVFSAEQGRSAANAFTCPAGQYLQVVAANGAPTCAADRDTDTNTTYDAGFGLLLEGNLFSAEQGRSAKFPFFCEPGSFMREVANDGFTTCDADQVGPTYAAGSGISITGTTISAHQSRTAANAFSCPAGQALRIVGADGAPTCTTAGYTAGSGLALNGTTFSSAYGASVIPVRGDGTPTENGTLLRTTMSGLTGVTHEKPHVLALAPGIYDLGAGNSLTMRPHVSVVGAGRGLTTITGARVSQSGGLVNLANDTLLAGVTVRNMVPAGTSFVTAIMSNGANTARLFDVHGYASQEGGETFGLLAFAGSNISVENSEFTVINPTAIGTGIYSISNTTVRARNVEVNHSALGGWALHAYNAGRIEFADGYAKGAVRKGTTDSTVHLTHSRVDGVVNGGVQCFGAYTSALVAASCT